MSLFVVNPLTDEGAVMQIGREAGLVRHYAGGLDDVGEAFPARSHLEGQQSLVSPFWVWFPSGSENRLLVLSETDYLLGSSIPFGRSAAGRVSLSGYFFLAAKNVLANLKSHELIYDCQN